MATHLGGGIYTSPEIEARQVKAAAEWKETQRRLSEEAAQRPRAKTIDELRAQPRLRQQAIETTGCIGDLSAHGKD